LEFTSLLVARGDANLFRWQFSPPQPDRMWHADYTELPTDQGPL
jgi:hypothetical protein